VQTQRIRLITPVLALALSACASAAQSNATLPRPSASQLTSSPVSTRLATPTPRVTVVDAAYVADELGTAEQAIRNPETPPGDYASLGQRQQLAYHRLAAHPDWVPAVLNAVPTTVRSAVQDNLTAAQQIGSLNGTSSSLPHWRIIAPPAPDVLLGYYNEAQQASGVPWQYLAAINLIETNMGRIQGLSSAGAQGPMQFMPATWASYGQGDVNNPHDAILAAGRYLHTHGAPQNMTRAIYAYNPSMLYVRAVQLYAQQMFANNRTFLGYYNWQVYVPTNSGDVFLPEGFSG
jgi:transglycosylase-like protein with SLT domain